MIGWRVFCHSVLLLIWNRNAAASIFWPMIATTFVVTLLSYARPAEDLVDGSTGWIWFGLTIWLIEVFVSIWVAIAWHRYILLEEEGSLLPSFYGRAFLEYFGAFLLVGLASGMLGLLVVVAVSLLFAFLGPSLYFFLQESFIPLPAFFVMFWITSRLSPVFPAVALGQKTTLTEAWRTTSKVPSSILMILPLFYLLNFAFGYGIGVVVVPVSSFLGSLITAAAQCIWAMIGISILTSIYGVVVEGREV